MEINFEYSFEPISTHDIEIFERKYNLSLPNEYKQFLILNNGGKTERRRFKTNDKTKEGTVTSSIILFFPLSKKIESNLEELYCLHNRGKIVPSNFLPIGIDPGDSLICLSIEGSDEGSVYHCDMDYFEEDKELKEEFIRLITGSFTDFINILFLPPK
ncbi:SMI1/KNR4 family protein [Brevibacillus laterosporus]|uniref:SMI1/KNR4 family protein n=1 Tax=Brevibacillus laterosporus TaxID=1465 RepID=UPI000B9B37D3|nr:SMI1/KNR4 family protein [Brevibacillus laterosporus]